MKILLTGGGSGGHFYPIIAIAEELRIICKEQKLLDPSLVFFGPTPYNEKALFEQQIFFEKVPAGKSRTYTSILNFLDYFKTAYGIIIAM